MVKSDKNSPEHDFYDNEGIKSPINGNYSDDNMRASQTPPIVGETKSP